MKQNVIGLLVLIAVASAHGATHQPPDAVTRLAGKPDNKKPQISLMTGSRISLQGKEHGGYLNWLVVRIPGTTEVRSVLLDDPGKGNSVRLSDSELKEMETWFNKTETEWTGSYAGNGLFRKLLLPGWGGLESHEEWQRGYIRFMPMPKVWVVACEHQQDKVKGPGSYLIGSTTYFDTEGNLLCSVPHLLFVD